MGAPNCNKWIKNINNVISKYDPWISLDKAKHFAQNWGSELITIGDAEHINVSSGYGKWQEGSEILKILG